MGDRDRDGDRELELEIGMGGGPRKLRDSLRPMIVLPLFPPPGGGWVVLAGVVCCGVAVVERLLGLSPGEWWALLLLLGKPGCLLNELGLEFAVEANPISMLPNTKREIE